MKNFKAVAAVKASKQAGFTIIELVVVILLLGILTATALPRFLDISTEAHNAAVDAVEGGLRTGGALFRAHWYAEGQPNGVVGNATEWDNQKANTTTGYPVGTSTGVSGSVIDLHTECEVIFEGILQSGVVIAEDAVAVASAVDATPSTLTNANLVTANAAGTYAWVAANTASNVCTFFYVADAARLTTGSVPNLVYAPTSTTATWTRSN